VRVRHRARHRAAKVAAIDLEPTFASRCHGLINLLCRADIADRGRRLQSIYAAASPLRGGERSAMSGRATHRESIGHSACSVCGKELPARRLRPWITIRPGLSELIHKDCPAWRDGAQVCPNCLARYRGQYVEKLLADEKGELAVLDRQVIASLANGGPVSRDTERIIDAAASFGDRMADKLASFGGSWGFIIFFSAVLIAWIALNTVGLMTRPFDPYPYILLNLLLSSLAALQAPVIMMSQRRQEEKDRLRSKNDYLVNLKAELEIRQLHEKLDHQLARQWEKLAELQQIQIELLEDWRRGGRN